jgi:hypothetical protein
MCNCLTKLEETDCGLRINELRVKCLLYDDQIMLTSSAEEFQEIQRRYNFITDEKV